VSSLLVGAGVLGFRALDAGWGELLGGQGARQTLSLYGASVQ